MAKPNRYPPQDNGDQDGSGSVSTSIQEKFANIGPRFTTRQSNLSQHAEQKEFKSKGLVDFYQSVIADAASNNVSFLP
jgi:hypothetical protein